MKIVRISLLLLILAVAIISGCKAAQDLSAAEPGTVLTPSEEVVDNGLQELDEIDSLEEDLDLGLDELETIKLE